MKAKELMIGDWVRVKPHKGYYEGITQVLGIPDRSTLKHNGHVYVELHYFDEIENCKSYEVEDCEDRHIEPIPLTEEMLKANGFIHKDTMDEWWHEEYDPELGMRMSDFELTDEFMFGRAKITYVHELQHALRLCGLQELADNFKVIQSHKMRERAIKKYGGL